jgi:hypothetical protein
MSVQTDALNHEFCNGAKSIDVFRSRGLAKGGHLAALDLPAALVSDVAF